MEVVMEALKRGNRQNLKTLAVRGRTTGVEPANGGTTIHCLNHLATPAIRTSLYHNIRCET